jgi:YHS domain-containing protein
MEQLLYFIIWAAAIFLMMRFCCGAHVMGHNRGHGEAQESPEKDAAELRWVPPEADVDPVCGKAVSTAEAKATVHGGSVYYFCSRECREMFEVAPELYINGPDGKQPSLEHSHA